MSLHLETKAGTQQRAMVGFMLSSRGVSHDEFKSDMAKYPDSDGYEFTEMARACLLDAGQGITSPTTNELFSRAMTTSDFPKVLSDIVNKFMEAGYKLSSPTWGPLAAKIASPNFKQGTVARLSPPSELPEVGESGEFRLLKIKEGDEAYQLKTYGGLLGLSRQLLVNDDKGAFKDIGRIQGLTAQLTQAQLFYALILSNPDLSDEVPVFAAARGNLLTGASTALDRDSLAVAVKAMRLMADDGGNPLAVEPKFLLVPPALEMTAHELCFSDSIPGQSNSAVPNLFKKIGLIPIVEPLLENPNIIGNSSIAWYLFPDPEIFPVFATVALGSEDNLAPFVASQPGWDTDNIEYKVRIDFGVTALGNKAVKSAGE